MVSATKEDLRYLARKSKTRTQSSQRHVLTTKPRFRTEKCEAKRLLPETEIKSSRMTMTKDRSSPMPDLVAQTKCAASVPLEPPLTSVPRLPNSTLCSVPRTYRLVANDERYRGCAVSPFEVGFLRPRRNRRVNTILYISLITFHEPKRAECVTGKISVVS